LPSVARNSDSIRSSVRAGYRLQSVALPKTVETVAVDNRFNGLPAALVETVETVAVDNRFNGLPAALMETVETVAAGNRFNGLPAALVETVETVAVDNRFNGLPASGCSLRATGTASATLLPCASDPVARSLRPVAG